VTDAEAAEDGGKRWQIGEMRKLKSRSGSRVSSEEIVAPR